MASEIIQNVFGTQCRLGRRSIINGRPRKSQSNAEKILRRAESQEEVPRIIIYDVCRGHDQEN